MAVSVLLAPVAGIPPVKTGDPNGIADVIGAGFSGTFSSIGIFLVSLFFYYSDT